jgi:hypothetical protein
MLALASAFYFVNLSMTFAGDAARITGDWRWNLSLLALALADMGAAAFMTAMLAQGFRGRLSEGRFRLLMLLSVPLLAAANFGLIFSYVQTFGAISF